MKTLTFLPFDDNDMKLAEEMAKRLGFVTKTGVSIVYNSVCDMPGIHCLAINPNQTQGAIVKTNEFGFLFIQDLNDLNFHDLHEKVCNSERHKYNFKEPADY